eukprot:CAMPEP_0204588562 /NCGR_PEP_ID=MMETSP0661-20131031/48690_1 /ASSEMBLY_ACC=CAM_ASM_000606 /TAXON_ID=109239 /ORGANISM="Alexandrium margalefi, Strain AMGDE01CS-322" /LENGTH=80 /DNA_ID=CAMNT_0051598381 /DNA_START=42 /DNA_END=281 /DNA_ORIENTATION=-
MTARGMSTGACHSSGGLIITLVYSEPPAGGPAERAAPEASSLLPDARLVHVQAQQCVSLGPCKAKVAVDAEQMAEMMRAR